MYIVLCSKHIILLKEKKRLGLVVHTAANGVVRHALALDWLGCFFIQADSIFFTIKWHYNV